MPATIERPMTSGEAARALGVSQQTVRLWVKDRRLPAEITPLGALIPRAAVETLAATRAGRNQP